MQQQRPKEPITAEEAKEAALSAIEEEGLGERLGYSILASKDRVVHPPLLARDQEDQSSDPQGTHYYIVPFGLRGEQECGAPLVRVAVLIDAYSRAVDDVTAFGRPLRYLRPIEALDAVAGAMGVEIGQLGNVKPGLIFLDDDIINIPAYPLWEVKIEERVFYVDQRGVLYNKLPPAKPAA